MIRLDIVSFDHVDLPPIRWEFTKKSANQVMQNRVENPPIRWGYS
jgi:hypothetical protein